MINLNRIENSMALQESKFYIVTYEDGYYQNGSMNGGYPYAEMDALKAKRWELQKAFDHCTHNGSSVVEITVSKKIF